MSIQGCIFFFFPVLTLHVPPACCVRSVRPTVCRFTRPSLHWQHKPVVVKPSHILLKCLGSSLFRFLEKTRPDSPDDFHRLRLHAAGTYKPVLDRYLELKPTEFQDLGSQQRDAVVVCLPASGAFFVFLQVLGIAQ